MGALGSVLKKVSQTAHGIRQRDHTYTTSRLERLGK